MLDPITLDQLRMLVAVVDEGSFSAAARKLKRVQSAVSHAMATLEQQAGVPLWDRSTKIPTLTEQGRVLLAAARKVCDDADAFRHVAEGLRGGLEPSISICVDAVFPTAALVELCRDFSKAFSTVPLRVYTETMGAVSARVLDGTCQIGIAGPSGCVPGLDRVNAGEVLLVPVVGKGHALAKLRGKIGTDRLVDEVQIVLSERGDARSPDQGVLSRQTWRVVDLHTKRELLVGGLGWGNLPEHMIRDDLRRGALVRIWPRAWSDDEHRLSLSIVHLPTLSRGPAARWLLDRIPALCTEHTRVQRRAKGPSAGGLAARRATPYDGRS